MKNQKSLQRQLMRRYVDLFKKNCGLLSKITVSSSIKSLDMGFLYTEFLRSLGVETIADIYRKEVVLSHFAGKMPADIAEKLNEKLVERRLPPVRESPYLLLATFFSQEGVRTLNTTDIAAIQNCYLDSVSSEVLAAELDLGDGGAPLAYALAKLPPEHRPSDP